MLVLLLVCPGMQMFLYVSLLEVTLNSFLEINIIILLFSFFAGLYVLTHALFMCNHINLYGFWPFSSFHDHKVPYHYYNKAGRGPTHTWNAEFEMLTRLHHERILNLKYDC